MGARLPVGFQYRAFPKEEVPHSLAWFQQEAFLVRGKVTGAAGDVVPGLLEQSLLGRLGELQQGGVNVQDESGGVPGGSVKVAAIRLGKVQPLLSSGQGNEGQTPTSSPQVVSYS